MNEKICEVPLNILSHTDQKANGFESYGFFKSVLRRSCIAKTFLMNQNHSQVQNQTNDNKTEFDVIDGLKELNLSSKKFIR